MLAGVLSGSTVSSSPWEFPAQRQAIFGLSVLLHTPPIQMARSARRARPKRHGRADEPQIPGTWAQVRIGLAIAQLLRGQLDAAQAEVAPVLDIAPHFRIAKVTGWLADLDGHLAAAEYRISALAIGLRHQIRDFTAAALPSGAREAG